MPTSPDLARRTAYRASREVRHTIIQLIGAHLKPGAAVSWEGLNLDLTGVVLDGGDFTSAWFSGCTVDFRRGFVSGEVDFSSATRWCHPPVFSWEG